MVGMVPNGRALTATKVTRPNPPIRYLDRPRLVERLDASLGQGCGLVLVSAPAGAGKSTLVSGWLSNRSGSVAWVQIDEADADPARFWSYVASSLAETVPAITGAVATAMSAGYDEVVTAVVNTVTEHADEVVLVLDDYHLIDNAAVHQTVEQLIGFRPSNLVLVVSTRVDPPFRLGRLRVRNQVAEIRAADLRFDEDEASWLLDAEALGLDRSAVDRLCDRTEGWAAGLVLAGLSLPTEGNVDEFVASFHGDDQLIADYLAEELLDSLDDDERARLLDASVLERMSGPLIDAVCGTDDGADWLRTIAGTNQLVIALDRTGTWFRFHHLLRDLLRLELERSAPERRQELHAAAGEWHRDDGDLEDAIEHFIEGGRRVEAADLVADNATTLLNKGRTYTVLRYIERLGDVLDEHSALAVVHGWTSFVTGRFGEAERALALAERLDVDGIDAGLICGLSAMIQLAQGDVSSGLAIVEDSPEVKLPTHAMVLGGVRVMAGLFDEARPYLARAHEMAIGDPDHFSAAVTPVFSAIADIETGQTAIARETAERAIAYADEHRFTEAPQLALAHSIVARTTDDPDQALAAARRGVQLARRSPEAVMLSYALASAADVAFDHDDPDAESMLLEARSIIDRCPDPGIAGRYLARVESRHGKAERPAAVGELVEELSDRELSVLRYLPSRLSQREIAGELYVSLNTVKTHCRSIYRKLAVDGRKPAVQAARDLGLL
jgi:ATP/maltotriose-dependent transcriptional regulator MalT